MMSLMNEITKQTRFESYCRTDKCNRQKVILETLGNEQLTAREISNRLGYKDLNYVRPRITELLQKGEIFIVGTKMDYQTNRNVAVYSVQKDTARRKTQDEINIIKSKLGIESLWSWSRYKTYKDDKFTYYLKYIKQVPPDRADSLYAPLGNVIHEIIENYHNGELDKSDLVDRYKEKLYELSLFGYKFDRNNEEKNQIIHQKYDENISHFLSNYTKPNYKTILEKFILTKITPKIYFQGYIDCIHAVKDNNGIEIWITDFKTSSLYKGDKINEMAGQLLLYAMAVHQESGMPYDRIHIQFHFLKYLKCTIRQPSGKTKERILERHNYVYSLSSNIRMWLKKSSEKLNDLQIELMLQKAIDENSLDILPDDVRNKFIIKNCYLEVTYSSQDIYKLRQDIISTVTEIENKISLCSASLDSIDIYEKTFWQDVTDKESFFMANLSEYSAKLHKPYFEYLSKRNQSNI